VFGLVSRAIVGILFCGQESKTKSLLWRHSVPTNICQGWSFRTEIETTLQLPLPTTYGE
jgi:hypothetical protein